MAARMGDPTIHGGVIILGEMTVMIGEVGMGEVIAFAESMSQAKQAACAFA